MTEVKSLPLGVTKFATFIDNEYIYVDKTDLIAQIAKYRIPIFLARPRRFGKSTLVSTFEELFEHGLERFKGLKIDTQNLWDDKTYKVLHLDFSFLKEDRDDISFANKLCAHLKTKLEPLGLSIPDEQDVIASFNNTLEKLIRNSLVLLIDEYDAPLTTVMGDHVEFERRRKILSEFFLSIKSYSDKFRFIFLTGVTRYSNVSIFSAFNNILEISFDPLYGALLGYTQQEIELYFKNYLERAALVLNQKENTTLYDVRLVLQKLKEHYDGYSFDKGCSTHVYNPWSILNFLNAPQNDFDNYWLETGGSRPSILVNYFRKVLDKKLERSVLLKYLDSDIEITVSKDILSPTIESIEESSFPFEAILYQSGYFTITRVRKGGRFSIGLPNLEVQDAFKRIVLEKLLNQSAIDFGAKHEDLASKALEDKNLSLFKELLNTILNEFSYESFPAFKEAHFRDIFKVTIKCIGFDTYSEYQTSQGRSDLCVVTDKYLYVIEFKVIDDNQDEVIKRTLEDAKTQVLEHKYNLRLDPLLKEREVVSLACVIVNQNKDNRHDKPYRGVVELEEV